MIAATGKGTMAIPRHGHTLNRLGLLLREKAEFPARVDVPQSESTIRRGGQDAAAVGHEPKIRQLLGVVCEVTQLASEVLAAKATPILLEIQLTALLQCRRQYRERT
jgi:hypothetical protein